MKINALSKSMMGAISACLLCVAASPAWATVIYTYTGNSFDTFIDESGDSPIYNETMNVTVNLELDSLLLPNLDEQDVNPISFSISDGINTIDNSNTVDPDYVLLHFNFSTDSLGDIIDWAIIGQIHNTGPLEDRWYIETVHNNSSTGMQTRDYGRIGVSSGYPDEDYDSGELLDNRGIWTVSTVPEPSILALLSLGLVGIGFTQRKVRS